MGAKKQGQGFRLLGDEDPKMIGENVWAEAVLARCESAACGWTRRMNAADAAKGSLTCKKCGDSMAIEG